MTAPEDIAQTAEAWKRKYYDNLEQAEQKERQWASAEDLLRKTISRLALAADGLDATLDRHLRDLRNAIRDRADSGTLGLRIEAMSASLAGLDEKSAVKRLAPGSSILAEVLERTPLPRDAANRAQALKKRLRKAKNDDTQALIREFSGLLTDALGNKGAQAATVDKNGAATEGWFGRMFPRRTAAQPEPARPSAERDAEHLGGQRQILLHLMGRLAEHSDAKQLLNDLRGRAQQTRSEQELRRLADALADLFPTSPSETVEADRVEALSIREVLIQLLERIDFTAEFETRVDSLKEQLEETTREFDANHVLRELAALVSDMRSRVQQEKQDIERFLKQLTDRLQDIDVHLRGTEEARADSFESGRKLGNAVQVQVRGIETSVRNADDLGQLKQTVQEKLDAILRHVEQHRTGEERRQQQVDAEVAELKQKLQTMEGETQELRSQIHQERTQALTDKLTGVPNRLAYDERIAQEYARWKRFNTPLALLVWDVDHFKKINDQYGHKAGDKALKTIAHRISQEIRETDFFARYGGEEFVLLMPGADTDAVLAVANKLRSTVADCAFHHGNESVAITISCGIAVLRSDDTPETAFERADRALYAAKAQGRNRCVMEESS